MMWKVTVLAVVIVLASDGCRAANLPCTSNLRTVLPNLFKHCSSCYYSPWSEWKAIDRIQASNCTSQMAFKETRSRYDFNKACTNESEIRHTCEPTIEEKAEIFIEALNLGLPSYPEEFNNFTDYEPQFEKRSFRGGGTSLKMQDGNSVSVRELNRCSPNSKICPFTNRQGKSISTLFNEFSGPKIVPVLDESINPTPFDLHNKLNDLHNYNRRRRELVSCNDRYLLLILDTSGSIGAATFNRMVSNLSDLVPLFCSNTKIAAMTFGTNIHREFCFNCYDNAYSIKYAMSSIPYHGGSTHTGRALKCACEEFLNTPCGLPNRDDYQKCPAPVDVLIITDGRSNGPLDVCEQAKCLHNQAFYDVNTFVIGVKNYHKNKHELDCIRNQNDLNTDHLFYMENFDALEKFLLQVIEKLFEPIDPSPDKENDPNNYRHCYDINNPFYK